MKYKLKTISEFPRYKIDTLGHLFNIKSGKELSGRFDRDGYHKVHLTNNFGKKNRSIHRLVAQTFIKNKNNHPLVCHNNNIPNDNRVENLRWDNQSGNLKDRYSNGTDFRGERNPASKLKFSDVFKIRNIYKTKKISQTELSKIYKVSQVNISHIIIGKSWRLGC